jgi:hypothetical protein
MSGSGSLTPTVGAGRGYCFDRRAGALPTAVALMPVGERGSSPQPLVGQIGASAFRESTRADHATRGS